MNKDCACKRCIQVLLTQGQRKPLRKWKELLKQEQLVIRPTMTRSSIEKSICLIREKFHQIKPKPSWRWAVEAEGGISE